MEKTEEALETLLKVGMKVIKATQDDGKIDMGEAIGISISAVGLVGIFKNLPVIGEELKNIIAQDITDLVLVFEKDFDLTNDELETRIKAGVEALAQMVIMLVEKKAA